MDFKAGLHVPEYIRTVVPYVPGKPIEETQREFKIRRVVKLASNENPLGPSPKAVRALQKFLKDLHRYPDGSGYRLKKALADHLGVDTRQLILGNGSDEVVEFLVRTYCIPGDGMVTSKAAFIAYKICAQVQGVVTFESPLTSDLRFDLPAILELVRKNDRVRLVFIANPNNPTGTYVGDSDLRKFLRDLAQVRDGSVIAVLDYAYWEYVQARDLSDPLSLLKEFSNVVILRTFSKVYGLAGVRLGYGIALPEIIASVEKVRQPFNINSMALVAAEAALGDQSFVKKTRSLNDRGKKLWEKELKKMGIPFWKSQGNFILVDTQKGLGKSGGEIYQECLRLGVIFRPLANYGLTALRVSVGTPEENQIGIKALRSLLEKN